MTAQRIIKIVEWTLLVYSVDRLTAEEPREGSSLPSLTGKQYNLQTFKSSLYYTGQSISIKHNVYTVHKNQFHLSLTQTQVAILFERGTSILGALCHCSKLPRVPLSSEPAYSALIKQHIYRKEKCGALTSMRMGDLETLGQSHPGFNLTLIE